MAFPDHSQRFDISDTPEVLDMLEEEATRELGTEQYQHLVSTTQTEIMNSSGTGDLPPGYDPDSDPLRKREHETARRVVLGTLATLGVVSVVGGIVAHSIKRKQHNEED